MPAPVMVEESPLSAQDNSPLTHTQLPVIVKELYLSTQSNPSTTQMPP